MGLWGGGHRAIGFSGMLSTISAEYKRKENQTDRAGLPLLCLPLINLVKETER